MAREILHRCEFCEQGFKTEGGFLRHKCKEMQRAAQFITVDGQSAWNYYMTWMKLQHRAGSPNSESFKKSKYFATFYNFTAFVKKTVMPDVGVFIDLMVRRRIDPKFWSSDAAYRKYLEFITRKLPVQDLCAITIKTLFDIAEKGGVDVNKVFSVLTPNEIIQLLHQRRLSPWFLLNSTAFAKFFINKTTTEERLIMQTIINPDYWTDRFKKNPKDIETVKQYITELGL